MAADRASRQYRAWRNTSNWVKQLKLSERIAAFKLTLSIFNKEIDEKQLEQGSLTDSVM
jgi:hypothetical protein